MESLRVAIGNKVKFTRLGTVFIGEVTAIRELSVVVKISEDDARTLKLDTPYTVVSNKNYICF